MFFCFSPTEILHISSSVLLYVFWFNFSFCVNDGLEKKTYNYGDEVCTMEDIYDVMT